MGLRRGWLRLHGQDVSRLQRILDPLVITGLFLLFAGDHRWQTLLISIPLWILPAIGSIVLLPRAGLYASYRSRSLRLLIWRIA